MNEESAIGLDNAAGGSLFGYGVSFLYRKTLWRQVVIAVYLIGVVSCGGAGPSKDAATAADASDDTRNNMDASHRSAVSDAPQPQRTSESLHLIFCSTNPIQESSVHQFVQQIKSTRGVKAVATSGIPRVIVRIGIDFTRLEHYQTVKVQDIVNALNSDANMGDVSELTVGSFDDKTIQLGDVARIEHHYAPDDVGLRYIGADAVSISVVPKDGYSPKTIFETIMAEALLQEGDYFVKRIDTEYQVAFSIWTPPQTTEYRTQSIESLLDRFQLGRYAPLVVIENNIPDATDNLVEDPPFHVLVILQVPPWKLKAVRHQLSDLFDAMAQHPSAAYPGDVDGIGSLNIFFPASPDASTLYPALLQMLETDQLYLVSWTKTDRLAHPIDVAIEVDDEQGKHWGISREDVMYYFDAALNGIDGVTHVDGKATPYHLYFDGAQRGIKGFLDVRVPGVNGDWVSLSNIVTLKVVPATSLKAATKPIEIVSIVSPENLTAAKQKIETWLSKRNFNDVRIEMNMPDW